MQTAPTIHHCCGLQLIHHEMNVNPHEHDKSKWSLFSLPPQSDASLKQLMTLSVFLFSACMETGLLKTTSVNLIKMSVHKLVVLPLNMTQSRLNEYTGNNGK